MLKQIAIYKFTGLPVFSVVGILALIFFLAAAYIGVRNMKGDAQIPMKWHFRISKVAIGLALAHAILAISLRF